MNLLNFEKTLFASCSICRRHFVIGNQQTFWRQISRSTYEFPELKETDLEEQFVHGWGPGGQHVNKSKNCVLLKHVPTGVGVRVHESRLTETNRKLARERLVEQVDLHLNGEKSFLALLEKEKRMKRAKKDNAKRKSREKKAEFAERVKEWTDKEEENQLVNETAVPVDK